ncbi:Nucleolin [Grifola frondosa]|uniref:Nucleolin n=1 Tax=Grifola frondosa TaxID=5627 RepID=A0A1C7M427_GRIFR|nr:Nucleolin [Grifola frondosa]
MAFASLAFALSPCIIVLRIIAIWNRNKIVILYVSVVYLLNFSLLIRVIIKGQVSIWDPASNGCVVIDTTNTRISGTASFVSDICLLVVMLIGIWRVKAPGSIWKRLYHQGVIWVLIATILYVPMVTFLWLDLNGAMNQMFLTPACVTLAICATRMHRDLYTFGRKDQNEVISFSSMTSWRVRAGGTAGENLMPMARLNSLPSQENGGTQKQYTTRDMDSVDGKNPPIYTGSRWEDQSDVKNPFNPHKPAEERETHSLVSNLPLSTTEAQVRELFAEYGGAYIRLRGVGYASAAFRSGEVARQALDDSKKKPLEGLPSRTLFAGNIPYGATEGEIRALFEGVAHIVKVLIARNARGEYRGFALVDLPSTDTVEQILKVHLNNPFHIRGRTLRLGFAKEMKRTRAERNKASSPQ